MIGPTRDFLEKAGMGEIGEKEKSFVDVYTSISYFDSLLKDNK
jgi:hypothetical protein